MTPEPITREPSTPAPETPETMATQQALLVLEDGRCFPGQPYAATGAALGEAVFCTAMTGYQETLTDPSYYGQIVVMTAPHIGNTGWNDEDDESTRIWVAGYVVREPARIASNWRSRRTLDAELTAQGIVGISGVDTRALTRHLRDAGAMRCGIFSGDALRRDGGARTHAELIEQVRAAAPMSGASLSGHVTTAQSYVVPPQGRHTFTVAAVDLGIKSMTPQLMARRGMRVHVLPADSTIDDISAVSPDGVFFSNGPGDPAAMTGVVQLIRQLLDRRIPVFGICFGNQLLGRALGLDTYKLVFGHRGINQPVLDKATGRVEITSQNHGFAVQWPHTPVRGAEAVSTEYGRVEASHVSLNDDVVEGLSCLDVPAFSVQYHPEAAAGPHDSAYLFDRFADLMTTAKDAHHAAS
jgi:carbamoyl-phosphate synthase small subunit